MEWLNYHHLLYFWAVAREGSIAQACETLHLAQPTVSAQIKKLEDTLGQKLFDRVGRKLVLTETGQTVFRYAEEIFSLGRELVDTVKGRGSKRPLRFTVGSVDVLPKMSVYRILEPAFGASGPALQLLCYEGKLPDLLAELALHRLDLVLADRPASPTARVRVYNHPLGDSGVSIFGVPALAERYRSDFPNSMGTAPLLLPTANTALRQEIDRWLDARGLRANVTGQIEDSALLKIFGRAGRGLFPAPSVFATEICQQYNVEVIGELEDVRERFYAISGERRLKHPAALKVCQFAREQLFSDGNLDDDSDGQEEPEEEDDAVEV